MESEKIVFKKIVGNLSFDFMMMTVRFKTMTMNSVVKLVAKILSPFSWAAAIWSKAIHISGLYGQWGF